MSRARRILVAILAALTVLVGLFLVFAPAYVDKRTNPVRPAGVVQVDTDAQALHQSLLIADLHADPLLWRRDLAERHQRGHLDLPRLRQANVALQIFGAVTKSPSGQNYQRNRADSDRITPLVIAQGWPIRTWTSLSERALYQAEKLHALAAGSDGDFRVITRGDELRSYLQARRDSPDVSTAGLLAIEGLHALQADAANLQRLFAAGYRMMGLAHFFDNAVAGSAHGWDKHGLTELGRRLVPQMEALGITIDLAHASPAAFADTLALATQPVVVSHGGVAATCPGPRNLSDAQLQALANNGGLVGIGLWAGAICDATPAGFVRAVQHVIDRIGLSHVALGTDFDGAVATPFDVTGLPQLTQALRDAGLSDSAIAAIMGGNVLRLLEHNLP